MDERLMSTTFEKQEKPRMVIYVCPDGHLRQALAGQRLTCNRCGKAMEPRCSARNAKATST